MMTRVATAALMIVVSVNSEPMIVIAPMVSTPAVGRFSFGCNRAEHRQEHLVAGRFERNAGPAEQTGEHRADGRDDDQTP